MVSLRSGSVVGKDQGADAGAAEVTSSKSKASRRSLSPAPARRTATKSASKKRQPTEAEETEFLTSPAMHTRAAGPVPAISLSTELPEAVLEAVRETPQPEAESPKPPTSSGRPATRGRTPAGQAAGQASPSPRSATHGTGPGSEKGAAASAAGRSPGQATKGVPSPKSATRRGKAIKASEESAASPETQGEVNGVGVSEGQVAAAGSAAEAREAQQQSLEEPGSKDGVQATNMEGTEQPAAAGGDTALRGSLNGAAAEAEADVSDLELPGPSSRIEEGTPSDSEESDSDSEADEGPMAGLAASLWTALQQQRQGGASGQPGPSATQSSQAGPPPARRKAAKPTEVEEIEWQPETRLPTDLQARDLTQPPASDAAEPGLLKELVAAPRDKKSQAKAAAAAQKSDWHDLPATVMTDEVKRDLRLLRLRGAMDPKRFYKKAEKGRFPDKFALGTVIEGPTEWYSGRLTNKERKQTITEELLADSQLQESRKRRFERLQEEKSRWSHKKHKGSGERLKKVAKRPKH